MLEVLLGNFRMTVNCFSHLKEHFHMALFPDRWLASAEHVGRSLVRSQSVYPSHLRIGPSTYRHGTGVSIAGIIVFFRNSSGLVMTPICVTGCHAQGPGAGAAAEGSGQGEAQGSEGGAAWISEDDAEGEGGAGAASGHAAAAAEEPEQIGGLDATRRLRDARLAHLSASIELLAAEQGVEAHKVRSGVDSSERSCET